MVVNTLFTWLPRAMRTEMATTEMKARIKAYSTRVWPFLLFARRSALYHEGHGQHILMSALHHECLLVTIFGERTNIGLVRFYAQQATGALNDLLKQAQAKEASVGPLVLDGDFLGDKAAIS